MHGIFLHILADALGSVGVIISSVLVKYYDLQVADPICSSIISVLIFASVIPLLKSSSETLLLKCPKKVS
jgi:zinc transporter 5/7